MREIVFDTETTGLSTKDGDRIIEIGGIELVNRFQTGRYFHYLINPEDREIHPDAVRIHGITNKNLSDKPIFADIVDEFENFFANAMLVAHNASFDIGFINAELSRLGRVPISNERIIDTLQIARRKHAAGPNSLDALCVRYGIDHSRRTKQHGALLDSELLSEVYIELLGGRQATLGFSDRNKDNHMQSALSETSVAMPAVQRPLPLPERLKKEDILRHREFIASLVGDTVKK